MTLPRTTALLPTRLVEKPWGMDRLPAPFDAPDGARIGEIWFEPAPELPDLLVKYLFVEERLSVQVHPSDAQAVAAGLGPHGKEECWLVVAAEPGAELGIGFRDTVDAGAMRAAAQDGSIERMLDWQPVAAGDVRYIPAGAVHAIGGGVCILEVQQASDITYRLYDYGRPRELHLDAAIAVARGEPHDTACRAHLPDRPGLVAQGPFFRIDIAFGPATERGAHAAVLAIPLDGAIAIAGEEVTCGQCAIALPGQAIAIPAGARCLIVRRITAPSTAVRDER